MGNAGEASVDDASRVREGGPGDSGRAASEKFIDGEWRQLTWNPLDGGWEYLTTRQWRMLKLRIPKSNHHLVKDDWQLAMLEGPESAVSFAFGLSADKHKATIDWLVNEYKKFKIATPVQLYNWSQFMMAVHPFHRIHAVLAKAAMTAALKKAIDEKRKCLLTALREESESFAVRARKSKRRR